MKHALAKHAESVYTVCMKNQTHSVASPARLFRFYAFAERVLSKRSPDWADLEAVEGEAYELVRQAHVEGWAPADRTKLNRIERRAAKAMDAAFD